MKKTSGRGKVAHNLGLSTWFGGTLFGQVSLNAAVSSISDKSERGRVVGTLPSGEPSRHALDATRMAAGRREGRLGAAGARPEARERPAAGRCRLQHGLLGCARGDGGEPGSGRLHSCEVRHDAGVGDASQCGSRPTTAAVFQRRFAGTVVRNDCRLGPYRDSRAQAARLTLPPYGLTATSGIKDGTNGGETIWVVQEGPAR